MHLRTTGDPLALTSVLRRKVTAIRPVDVVQLIGTGMCLGGAVVALVFALTAPPSS
ncbi:MAG TPA: hypothetical protein VFT47_13700 [Vicinamibacterales bacterium]|nr:hypothetical protein [Vicinamibacterales bacterium]